MDDVVAAAHTAMVDRNWAALRLLLHPYLQWRDGAGRLVRGRVKVLAMLDSGPTPGLPAATELRDGQIYRWVEAEPRDDLPGGASPGR